MSPPLCKPRPPSRPQTPIQITPRTKKTIQESLFLQAPTVSRPMTPVRPSAPSPSLKEYRNKKGLTTELPLMTKGNIYISPKIHSARERYLIEKDGIVNTVRMEHMTANSKLEYNNVEVIQEKMKIKKKQSNKAHKKNKIVRNFRKFLDGEFSPKTEDNDFIISQNYKRDLEKTALTKTMKEQDKINKEYLKEGKNEYLEELKEYNALDNQKLLLLQKEAQEIELDKKERIQYIRDMNNRRRKRQKNNLLIGNEINRRQRQYLRAISTNNYEKFKDIKQNEINRKTAEIRALNQYEKEKVNERLYNKYEELREKVRTQREEYEEELEKSLRDNSNISITISRKSSPTYFHRSYKR